MKYLEIVMFVDPFSGRRSCVMLGAAVNHYSASILGLNRSTTILSITFTLNQQQKRFFMLLELKVEVETLHRSLQQSQCD